MEEQSKSTKNPKITEASRIQEMNGIENPAMDIDDCDRSATGNGESLDHRMSISNPESVNCDGLVNKLRVRFQKKVRKCELRIKFYTSLDSLMNIVLLSLQVLQMALQPLRDVWLSNESLIILQNLFIAITAILAGLQLKIKFNEKADKYRKTVKIYYHLLRMTSYYVIMAESGGIADYDSMIGLWQDALKKELESLDELYDNNT